MTFYYRDGMKPNRHTSLLAPRATFARVDTALIERVRKERRRQFNDNSLPEHIRYTAEEYDADDHTSELQHTPA